MCFEMEKAHSSTLAWKIPWMEEPDGLQFMGLQRVGHDWSDWAHKHNKVTFSLMKYWKNIHTDGQHTHKKILKIINYSVQFSRSVESDSLWPHESQHTRPPCPSPTPKVHSDSRPSSRWCHPTISFSVLKRWPLGITFSDSYVVLLTTFME